MASPESQLTIPEALRISAQDERGDMKPAMTKSHRETFDKMLQRVQAQPTTYIMTPEEFAVFRHYPHAFIDNDLAQEAVERFWEYHSRKLVDEQEAKESKDFHIKTPKTDIKTPKTDSLQDRNSTFDPFPRYNTQSQNQASVATRVSRRNNTTRYRSRASTTAYKDACELCIQRRLPCDGKRPYCGCCGRANFLACVYAGGTGDFSLKPPVFDTGIMRSNESSVTPTLSHQSSVQLRNLSSFEGCDRTDKHDAADACEQHGQKRTECEEEHPESSENLSQEPHEKIRISYGAYRERNPVSRDGQANKEDEPRLQTWDTSPDHLKSSESLSLDLSQFRMRILNGTEYNFTNSLKLRFQSLTGEPWDWWPLRPCFQQLLDDEVRIHWYCDSGHAHWTVLSKSDLVLALEALNSQATTRSVPSERKNPQSSSKSRSSARSSRSSGSETSLGDSSPATSEGGSSDQPDDDAGSGKKTEPSGTSTAVDIIPPSSLVGFVLFGVHGSKRLHNASLRLAQINVAAYKDDDSFFEEMNVQYQTLRGFLRRVFSIWIFHTCEFIMFYKSNPNEIMPGPQEMPSRRNRDYNYNASRSPPILKTVFNANFYGCKKGCIKSQLDLFCLLHECKGRNHCGKYRVLDRLPKRRRKWDIDQDEEVEEAWGLNTVFAVSFSRVTLYHMLILVGPILFWGLWLQKWPSDWQNASVPFFAVVVLLSLFWLPFAHKASSRDSPRSSKNKSI